MDKAINMRFEGCNGSVKYLQDQCDADVFNALFIKAVHIYGVDARIRPILTLRHSKAKQQNHEVSKQHATDLQHFNAQKRALYSNC